MQDQITFLLGKDSSSGGGNSDLENEFRIFKLDFTKFREDVGNSFKIMTDQLSRKADKTELVDLENRIIDKLNEMLKNMFA